MCYEQNSMIEALEPTFLYTCKPRRVHSEKNYHSHDHMELGFILAGSGKYHIDGTMYSVTEGDLLLLNPGTKHESVVTETETPMIEFFVAFCDFQFRDLPKNFIPLPNDEVIMHTKGELRQRLYKICMSIAAENSVCQEGRYFMLKSYLVQMLLLIVREQTTPVQISSGYSFDSVNKKYVVEQIVSYFENHYSEKISLDRIAENMYLSPFYISKIFKSETGDAPIHHLISIRLEKAKQLLENGYTNSIQEVAAAVGYEDAYHFSKLFKKHYGVSPSKMKQKH